MALLPMSQKAWERTTGQTLADHGTLRTSVGDSRLYRQSAAVQTVQSVSIDPAVLTKSRNATSVSRSVRRAVAVLRAGQFRPSKSSSQPLMCPTAVDGADGGSTGSGRRAQLLLSLLCQLFARDVSSSPCLCVKLREAQAHKQRVVVLVFSRRQLVGNARSRETLHQ
mmetsp:Transcript_10035/g.30658  ORF Transcript_10035/g.30658 Transcript_10035/m.30658 type:complete len:167 (+) Transcript_10035:1772-2272(+)